MDNVLIYSNFKQLRENLNLTQDQLAEYLEKSREEISYYETGKREIPLSVLEKAADLFGVSLSDFFEEKPSGITFAFRADDLNKSDLETISKFKRIMKNYQRINRLTEKA